MHSGRLRGSLISAPTISIELLLRLHEARLILPNTMLDTRNEEQLWDAWRLATRSCAIEYTQLGAILKG